MEEKHELTTTTGFMLAYFENLRKSVNQNVAYEITEEQYMQTHNTTRRRYASFDYFRKVKNNFLKKHNIT
jgi:hypothetical protein